jgi:DNA-binding LacI/PurR family transcriptional regulator
MTKIRLKDVAQAAGVSQGTASNVFNRPALVRAEVREAVLQAAARLGYGGPAPAGRALRSGKAHLIALVVEQTLEYMLTDAYSQRLLAGIARVCDEVRSGLAVVAADDAVPGPGWSVDTAIADGFILLCHAHRLIDRARRRGIPFVAVDSGAVPGVATVDTDNRAAAARAAAHLLALGHRRIGVLSLELAEDERTGPIDAARRRVRGYAVSRDRIAGYLEPLAAAGIEPEDVPIYETFNDVPTVTAGIDWLLAREPGLTGVLAMSDTIARAAIVALVARGLSVPGDVSVVGFDDVGADGGLPLTTLAQPIEAKGALAARMLLGLEPGAAHILPSPLVVRASTGRARSRKAGLRTRAPASP